MSAFLEACRYKVGDRVRVRFSGAFDRVEKIHESGAQYHYRLEEAGDVMSREIEPCGGAKLAITGEEFPVAEYAADKVQVHSRTESKVTLNAMVLRNKRSPPLSYVLHCDTVIAAIGALAFIKEKHAGAEVRHEIRESVQAVHTVVDFSKQEGCVA